MYEPLRGKIDGCEEAGYVLKVFQVEDVKSAVEGLIKYHEGTIEKMIKQLQDTFWYPDDSRRYSRIETIEMHNILRNIAVSYTHLTLPTN